MVMSCTTDVAQVVRAALVAAVGAQPVAPRHAGQLPAVRGVQ